MQKILFDIDDTLLMFDKEYIKTYQIVLAKNGYPSTYEDAYHLFKTIGKYEELEDKYEENKLLSFMNQELQTNYSKQVVLDIITIVGEKWTNPIPLEVVDTLEYLSKKYELFILTNWFTSSQRRRLEKVGILSYFKEVVGGDIVPLKPRKEAFLYFGDPSLSIMIGDRIDIDIEGALEVGMRAILFDYYHQFENTKYEKIHQFIELKTRL